jgi:hypothetical protein
VAGERRGESEEREEEREGGLTRCCCYLFLEQKTSDCREREGERDERQERERREDDLLFLVLRWLLEE